MDATPLDRSLLWRRRRTVAAIALLVVAAALATSFVRTPVYDSTAQVLVDVPPRDGVEIQPNMDNEKRIASSLAVAEIVASADGSDRSVQELLGSLSVDVPVNTDILSITYAAGDPSVARSLAGAFADAYVRYRTESADANEVAHREDVKGAIEELRRRLEQVEHRAASARTPELQAVLAAEASSYIGQITSLEQELQSASPAGFEGRVIARAQMPTSPVRPDHVLDGIIGLFVGLMAGIGIAFGLDRTDRRPRSAGEIEELLAAPVLGSVPAGRRGTRPTEPYRLLAARIVGGAGTEPTRLVVAPCVTAGQQSLIGSSLGRAWAMRSGRSPGRPVVVVRANEPTVRSRVDGGGRGFTDALEGRIDTVDLGLDLEPEDGVIVVPFGAGGLGPEDLVPTTRLDATLAHFVRLGVPVIIEAPPLLSGLAAETLASVADAVVVVVEQGVTRDELERVRTLLAQVGVSPVGAVVVSRERARDGHSRAPVRSDQRAGTSASR